MSSWYSSDQVNVRSMLLQDLDAVMCNEREAYPIPWSEGVMTDCINGRNHCLVLEVGGVLAGHAVIMIVADETHLLNVCISPAFSRQGLGRFFLKYLIDEAIARHSTVFFLEVRVSNLAAAQLYLSEGFNEVGIRPNYYPTAGGREDALVMTLDLRLYP